LGWVIEAIRYGEFNTGDLKQYSQNSLHSMFVSLGKSLGKSPINQRVSSHKLSQRHQQQNPKQQNPRQQYQYKDLVVDVKSIQYMNVMMEAT
jgi:hypothetical protein